MPTVPPPRPCTSYAPGHTVHWIQALRSANDPSAAALTRRGRLVAVEGQRITLAFAGRRSAVLYNHDPQRLLAVAGTLPCPVTLNERFAILRIPPYCFSVAREPLGPCPVDVLEETDLEGLAQRALTHGGFTVRLGELG